MEPSSAYGLQIAESRFSIDLQDLQTLLSYNEIRQAMVDMKPLLRILFPDDKEILNDNFSSALENAYSTNLLWVIGKLMKRTGQTQALKTLKRFNLADTFFPVKHPMREKPADKSLSDQQFVKKNCDQWVWFCCLLLEKLNQDDRAFIDLKEAADALPGLFDKVELLEHIIKHKPLSFFSLCAAYRDSLKFINDFENELGEGLRDRIFYSVEPRPFVSNPSQYRQPSKPLSSSAKSFVPPVATFGPQNILPFEAPPTTFTEFVPGDKIRIKNLEEENAMLRQNLGGAEVAARMFQEMLRQSEERILKLERENIAIREDNARSIGIYQEMFEHTRDEVERLNAQIMHLGIENQDLKERGADGVTKPNSSPVTILKKDPIIQSFANKKAIILKKPDNLDDPDIYVVMDKKLSGNLKEMFAKELSSYKKAGNHSIKVNPHNMRTDFLTYFGNIAGNYKFEMETSLKMPVGVTAPVLTLIKGSDWKNFFTVMINLYNKVNDQALRADIVKFLHDIEKYFK